MKDSDCALISAVPVSRALFEASPCGRSDHGLQDSFPIAEILRNSEILEPTGLNFSGPWGNESQKWATPPQQLVSIAYPLLQEESVHRGLYSQMMSVERCQTPLRFEQPWEDM